MKEPILSSEMNIKIKECNMKTRNLSFVNIKRITFFIAAFSIIHPLFSQIRLESGGRDAANQFVKKMGEYSTVDLVKRGDYYGIMFQESFIVQPEFEEIEEVKSSRLFQESKEGWWREETGAHYIPVIAKKNGKYGLMTILGEKGVDTIIPFQYDTIEYALRRVLMHRDSRDAHCFYFQKDGKWGLIVPNYSSAPVTCVDEKPIPIFYYARHYDYDSYNSYICGFIVKVEGKYGILANGLTEEKKCYVSLENAYISLENTYDDIRYYNNNYDDNYLVVKKDGKCGFVFDVKATNNDIELPFEDVLEKNDSNGYFAVKYEGKWGFVNYSRNQYYWVVKPIYDKVENIEENNGSTNVWKKGKKYRLVWNNHKHKYIENKY